jgi:hypothetical protein
LVPALPNLPLLLVKTNSLQQVLLLLLLFAMPREKVHSSIADKVTYVFVLQLPSDFLGYAIQYPLELRLRCRQVLPLKFFLLGKIQRRFIVVLRTQDLQLPTLPLIAGAVGHNQSVNVKPALHRFLHRFADQMEKLSPR